MVDVEKFFRDGYVIVEGAIDAETIDAVKRDITAKVNEEEDGMFSQRTSLSQVPLGQESQTEGKI